MGWNRTSHFEMSDPQVPQSWVNEALGAIRENNQEQQNQVSSPPPANDAGPAPLLEELSPVARLFTAAVRCSLCGYANDLGFCFCHMCVYRRKTFLAPPFAPQTVDVSVFDSRLYQLQMSSLSTSYSQQKSSLKSKLESFLFSLPARKSLCTAHPLDLCRFLAWKDKDSKTKVH